MNTIQLHQYPAAWKLPSLSPFCIKVETYLKMTGIPYKIVVENNPMKGPRGRMPYIRDGKEIVSDSHFILKYLESKRSQALDAHLTVAQKATSLAFHRLMDQDLIRVILYSRWADPIGWNILKDEFHSAFPFGLRRLAIRAIRASLVAEARGNGILEYTREEIYALGEAHLEAISAQLGTNDYFFGERPSTIDATVYAFLAVIFETPIPVPLKDAALKRENLVRYCERMRTKFFENT